MAAEATNGSLQANGKLHGRTAASRRNAKAKKGFFARLFSIVTRLLTWGAILTVLFRCPATLEECDESSPFVCQHYFRLKHKVSPHLQPYYDQYAAHYVDIAEPYYVAVKDNVIVPSVDYAVHYGAPWAKAGQEYAWSQWERTGQPHLVRLQGAAREHYDKTLAPHVAQAQTTLGPHYETAKVYAIYVFDDYVTPGYQFVKPYAIQGYDAAYHTTATTIVPAVSWAWHRTNSFLDTAVWPQLRVVYVENVEPQLVRIGDRLDRYKSKAKLRVLKDKKTTSRESTTSKEPATTTENQAGEKTQETQEQPEDTISEQAQEKIQETETSSSETSISESSTSTASEPESTASVVAEEPPSAGTDEADDANEHRNPVSAPPAVEGESEQRRKAREMVAEDLKQWQNKFASQAEEGAADIEERVDQIAYSMMTENARKQGENLVQQLEATIKSQVQELKATLNRIATSNEDDAQEESESEAIAAIRAAGIAIKGQAQAVRDWRIEYDVELKETVLAMADVHFKVLDETRSLALQQLGMKWAWTDGVTYKDWAKYHELKSTLREWTDELKELIVTHPTLLEAQDASAKVEDEAMEVASGAARQLAELKEVAKLKIETRDGSDLFTVQSIKDAIAERERIEQERLAAEAAAAAAAEAAAAEAAAAEAAASEAAEAAARESAAAEAAEAAARESAEAEADAESTFVLPDNNEEQKPLVREEETAEESVEESVEEASEEEPASEQPIEEATESVEEEEPEATEQNQAAPEETEEEEKEPTEESSETVEGHVEETQTTEVESEQTSATASD